MACWRYYDGLCPGGPCDECEHNPNIELPRTKRSNRALKAAVVLLLVVIALVVAI